VIEAFDFELDFDFEGGEAGTVREAQFPNPVCPRNEGLAKATRTGIEPVLLP
jgi:hypothetical protein